MITHKLGQEDLVDGRKDLIELITLQPSQSSAGKEHGIKLRQEEDGLIGVALVDAPRRCDGATAIAPSTDHVERKAPRLAILQNYGDQKERTSGLEESLVFDVASIEEVFGSIPLRCFPLGDLFQRIELGLAGAESSVVQGDTGVMLLVHGGMQSRFQWTLLAQRYVWSFLHIHLHLRRRRHVVTDTRTKGGSNRVLHQSLGRASSQACALCTQEASQESHSANAVDSVYPDAQGRRVAQSAFSAGP